jgi:hypothetical protein
MLRWARDGAAYVPFIGDGDIAVEVFSDRHVFGADIDSGRVATCRQRLTTATLEVADCDRWPFVGCRSTFAVADFDAYTYPYESFRAFWRSAKRHDRLVLFFTDTVKQAVKRSGMVHHPDGSKFSLPALPSRKRSAVYNSWFTKWIWPWFTKFIRPYRVLDKMHYLRQDTVYWAAAIELSQR